VFKQNLDLNSLDSKETILQFARETISDFPSSLETTDFVVEMVSQVDATTVVLTISSWNGFSYSVSLRVPVSLFFVTEREFIHELVGYDD
jgi:hypothetical protein